MIFNHLLLLSGYWEELPAYKLNCLLLEVSLTFI